jgi:hypothetical protein
MRMLTAAAVALGLTLAVLAAPASAGQVQQVPTTVAIYGAETSDTPPKPRARLLFTDLRFYGRVTAGRKRCARLRKVDLFEKRDGSDLELGTGFSDSLGYWSINSSSENLDTGRVYAKAPKAKRGNLICKPDRSAILVLT